MKLEDLHFEKIEEMRISYRKLLDEKEIICPKCGEPLPMKKKEYIHRHDGGNETETYMAIDDEWVWELYDEKYCLGCVDPSMDKSYCNENNPKVKCEDKRECVYKVGKYKGTDSCPVASNEDVVVGCHSMIEIKEG